jgi:hypothetical protein
MTLMRRGAVSGLAFLLVGLTLFAPAALGGETHVYPVTLTIAVDREAGRIGGVILTDAPSEFCESSTVRVRRVMPGRDEVVARLFPGAGKWGMKSPKALRGERVYAEVLPYHLPSRPVECLGDRSRAVTAP